MPHSVAPRNAAVCNKSKGTFRRPTVRTLTLRTFRPYLVAISVGSCGSW